MKQKRRIKIVLCFLLIVLFLIGIALGSINVIRNRMRQIVSDGAIEVAEKIIIEGGDEKEVTVLVPKTGFLAVDGEEGEDDASLAELLHEMQAISSEHEELKLLGILEIPCINVKEPIWESCTSTVLRYGVGRFPQTCNIGENANCTLFGHRMRQSKTIFWQLQTLERHIGEEVIVTTIDGVKHIYTISDTVYVKDADIDPYLRSGVFDSEHLCLATCGYGEDPYDKSIYRAKNTEFIVICVPES